MAVDIAFIVETPILRPVIMVVEHRGVAQCAHPPSVLLWYLATNKLQTASAQRKVGPVIGV